MGDIVSLTTDSYHYSKSECWIVRMARIVRIFKCHEVRSRMRTLTTVQALDGRVGWDVKAGSGHYRGESESV